MAGQHCDVVILSTRQVWEITVGVIAVTLSVVAEASPGVHRVRRGIAGRVPGDDSDASLAVHLCREVGGNTGCWWRKRHVLLQSAGVFKLIFNTTEVVVGVEVYYCYVHCNIIKLPENLLYFQVKKVFYIMNK